MTERAKWGLLALLVLIWAGLFALRAVTQEEPARVPLKHRSGQTLSKAAAAQASGIPTVAKPAKPREGDLTFQTPKNIFAPLESPVDVAEQQAKVRARVARSGKAGTLPVVTKVPPPPPPPSPEEVAAQQARQQREMAAQRARQAMAQYRFIGYLTQNGEPRAFLGKGRELYIVRAGETLEGQIHVATIETSSLKLRDGASQVESALPLVKEGGKPGEF